MSVEASQVQWGTTRIQYRIRRSPRRKTVAITVDAADGVLLTAPKDTSVEKLNAVVRARANWIVTKLRHVAEQADKRTDREWVSGESILYLGRHYRLRVQKRARARPARLVCGRLVVQLARDTTPQGRIEAVRASVVSWFRDHAEKRIKERVRIWAPVVKVDEPSLVVPSRSPTKRWGSCDRNGVVRINWRIIQAPMRLVDYVVAHELVHLVHRDHDEAFWLRLEEAMPDHEARREALRRLGPELEW